MTHYAITYNSVNIQLIRRLIIRGFQLTRPFLREAINKLFIVVVTVNIIFKIIQDKDIIY